MGMGVSSLLNPPDRITENINRSGKLSDGPDRLSLNPVWPCREEPHTQMTIAQRLEILQKHRAYPLFMQDSLTPVVIYEWSPATVATAFKQSSRTPCDSTQLRSKQQQLQLHKAGKQELSDTMSEHLVGVNALGETAEILDRTQLRDMPGNSSRVLSGRPRSSASKRICVRDKAV